MHRTVPLVKPGDQVVHSVYESWIKTIIKTIRTVDRVWKNDVVAIGDDRFEPHKVWGWKYSNTKIFEKWGNGKLELKGRGVTRGSIRKLLSDETQRQFDAERKAATDKVEEGRRLGKEKIDAHLRKVFEDNSDLIAFAEEVTIGGLTVKLMPYRGGWQHNSPGVAIFVEYETENLLADKNEPKTLTTIAFAGIHLENNHSGGRKYRAESRVVEEKDFSTAIARILS